MSSKGADPDVAVFAPDLMDRSRIAAALPAARFVGRVEDLAAQRAAVAVVDLGRPGVLDTLPAVVAGAGRVVAFGSHVDDAVLAAARTAGCAEVLARSQFFRRLPDVVTRPRPDSS